MSNTILKKTKTIIIVMVIAVLSACEWLVNDQERIDRASNYIAEGNYHVAIIELKKVLQHDNTNIKARMLLSQGYLMVGNGVAAENELRRAEILGKPHVEIVIPLSHALLLQRKYEELLNETQAESLGSSVDRVKILTLRGDAYLGLKQYDNAKTTYGQALRIEPRSIKVLLGLSRTALQQNNLRKADEYLKLAENYSPDKPDIWIVRGLYYQQQGDHGKAESAFSKALQLDQSKNITESKFQAMIGLITSQASQNKLVEAAKTVEDLQLLIPKHPYPKYLNAWITYQNKQYKQTNDLLLDVQKQLPDHAPSLFLLGASNYALGNFELSNLYLTRFVKLVPNHIQGHRLLAASRLKLQLPEQTLELLQTEEKDIANDALLLVMAGYAAASLGNTEMQLNYLKKATTVAPSEATIRSELARAYLQLGLFQEAISELESLKRQEDDHRQSDILLVYTKLRIGDINAARAQAEELLKQTPDDPALFVLRGSVELTSGNRKAAEYYYREAQSIKQNYLPAKLGLARIKLEEGNLAEAAEEYDQVLLIDKHSVTAMLGHAQIAEQRGERQQAIKWVEAARASNEKVLLPRVILSRYYLLIGNTDAALEIAKEVYSLQPNNASSLLLLGRAQQLSGHTQSAINTFEKLIAQHPKIINTYLELANSYANAGDYKKARAVLLKGLSVQPDSIQIKIAQVRLELLANNDVVALQIAKQIQQEYSKNVIGFSLAGDIYYRQRNYPGAQKAYQKALSIKPSSGLTIKLAKAYSSEGESLQAVRVLERGLENLSGDITIRTALAASYQKRGELTLAEKHYLEILKQQPENPIILNNMALLYADRDIIEAIKYAQDAYRLAPESIAIADTLGWLQVQNGQINDGLALLQHAASKSNEPTIQYHLAAALAKSGKSNEAYDRLTRLLDSDIQFKERQQAQQLLKSLPR